MEEQEIYLLITRYLAQKTTTEENELLADWISASPDHERIFEEIKQVWQDTAPDIKSDTAAALLRLREKIEAEEQPAGTKDKPGVNTDHVFRLKPNRLVYLSLAASFLGFLICTSLYVFFSSQPERALHMSTGLRQKKSIILDDGTKITLAPQSELIYPAHFTDKKRVVDLRGQAYFEVSKNPHRPFIVHTSKLDIKVLGTHFDVNTYATNPFTTVSLLEGKVAVKLLNEEKEEYILKPNQQLTYNHVNQQVYQNSLDTGAVTGWMTNKLVFKNERFAEAAEKISHLYGIKIVMADQATADTRLYGTFNDESLHEVMETIKLTGNIEYRIENNKIYINLKR